MEKTSVKFKLIDEDAIPGKVKKRHGEWLKMLKEIPRGKAWVATEEEAGVKAVSIKAVVTKLVETGELPKSYKAMQRTKDGKITIYILNSAKE